MGIYLDNNATTALHPRVQETMVSVFRQGPSNASARHSPGRKARFVLERAREQMAALLKAEQESVVFTGSGTEANNLALLGTLRASSKSSRHLVVSAQEHHAVLNAAHVLKAEGVAVTLVTPDSSGRVSVEAVRSALRGDTVLVSIMHANNETGVIQPVSEIAAAVHAHGALMHTDAVQTTGKMSVDVNELGVDFLSLSGHKFYGPQGIGALFVRDRTAIVPQIVGGGQEDGLRAGTSNLAAIAGLGEAAFLADKSSKAGWDYMEAMRAVLEDGIARHVPEAVIIGREADRLTNTSLVCFPGRDGRHLAAQLDEEGVFVSTGAACTTDDESYSHVLMASGVPDSVGRGAVRFSLGHDNTEQEMVLVIRSLLRIIGRRPSVAGLVGKALSLVGGQRRT